MAVCWTARGQVALGGGVAEWLNGGAAGWRSGDGHEWWGRVEEKASTASTGGRGAGARNATAAGVAAVVAHVSRGVMSTNWRQAALNQSSLLYG